MARIISPCILFQSRRLLSTSSIRPAFAAGPAPPRLPPKDQEEFERLQRNSTGAFSIPHPSVTSSQSIQHSDAPPRSPPQINRSPASNTRSPSRVNKSTAASSEANSSSVPVEEVEIATGNTRVQATGKGEELHPDIRRGAKPEFEGDVNPVTGEVGGPKNEPLRWGSTGERGDWSYNGRVTDF